jgi:hypothetical protein
VQIIRLTRSEGRFSAHLVPAEALSEALRRPTLKAESVLDGIFSQAVVVVEADGDRSVYQAVWETLDRMRLDVHFATVGGTGGIADTCGLYRTLRIPVAVIADLDMIVDEARISRVLASLIPTQLVRDKLVAACTDVASAIRQLPPTIVATDLQSELVGIAARRMDWSQRDDVDLRRTLRDLSNRLDRMGRLKRGGLAAYDGALRHRLENVITELRQHGLFLVPVGELEEWLAGYSLGVSKSDKRAWSNAAAELVQAKGRQDGDVWAFVEAVGQYLIAPLDLAESGSSRATASPVATP